MTSAELSHRPKSALSLAGAMLLGSVATLPAAPIFFDGFDDAGTRGWSATSPTTCTDGRKNGDETDVDCGGASCLSCPVTCAPRGFGEIGGPCGSDDDCGTDGLCFVGQLNSTVYAPEGYCMVLDVSFATPKCATDADCGDDELCVEWFDFFPYKHCMPACTCAGEACPEHQVCANVFNGLRLSDAVCTPGDASAVDGSACAGIYECDELSSCFVDAEHPNGECQRTDCVPGDAGTCNGGLCISADPGATIETVCVDPCLANDDCREGEGYRCADPDGDGGEPAYCRHPRVGDACGSADDCGGGSWQCRTDASHPDGHCTLLAACPTPGSISGCTEGSVCYDDPVAPNYCVDRCNGEGQGTCRSNYACTDTDPSAGTVALGCTPT